MTGFASGDMSSVERHVKLQRLRQLDDDERGVLANARWLAEGVDVPTLDGVAFIDPRGSEVDIVQAVGRAIRLAESKTVGTIVIPVFIDTAAEGCGIASAARSDACRNRDRVRRHTFPQPTERRMVLTTYPLGVSTRSRTQRVADRSDAIDYGTSESPTGTGHRTATPLKLRN
ncbi:hypothetical protein ASG56_06575 [Rhodococcus sp. Leaf7]|nr:MULTISPECIES: helicase-related protein [unclassified Rhodococcus (in: high G+C Gram-positive bacteria)]KIQ17441.1 hypothetical protein RU01_09585 [Rhodococcus sp. MEB064]KQU07196.1 hypothetical protein ASG56_06575 [Rhodococcus sp. Leaf7]KQU42714.1 hypothetical protein ASG64_06575 [Rhodococcus sp. Leaf247]